VPKLFNEIKNKSRLPKKKNMIAKKKNCKNSICVFNFPDPKKKY